MYKEVLIGMISLPFLKNILTKIPVVSFLILLNTLFFANAPLFSQEVVGYYTSWNNVPSPNSIDFNDLTMIIHAFASPNPDGTVGLSDGVPNPALIQATHNANKKILISFGEGGDSTGFYHIVSDTAIMTKFINNVYNFIKVNNYDGIDIDWEFPNKILSAPFTALIRGLRQKFNSVDSSLIITMAIPSSAYYGQYFQYSILVNYVNWFSIMAYDYYGSWSNTSGHNAPFYQSWLDPNQAGAGYSSILYMIGRGVGIPKNKLLFGEPFYGKEFNAPGLYKKRTGDVPSLTYSQIIDSLNSGNWKYNWDSVSAVPYLLNKDTTRFITYDDTNSIKIKTESIKSLGLGGVMIWALGYDLEPRYQETLLHIIGNILLNKNTTLVSNLIENRYTFYLSNNYPNPFNPSTNIAFTIPKEGFVSLKVYNTLGQVITTLVNGNMAIGSHQIEFHGSRFSSGIYFYVLNFDGHNEIKKMMLIK